MTAVRQDLRCDLRQVAGSFPTGVTVVSTRHEDAVAAMTVNAFATVSLAPPLLLISIASRSRMLPVVRAARAFAVTVLTTQQEGVARWFADRTRPPGMAAFAAVETRPAPVSGSPVLADGRAYFDCRLADSYPGGDHTILVGEIVAFDRLRDEPPLLFVDGAFA